MDTEGRGLAYQEQQQQGSLLAVAKDHEPRGLAWAHGACAGDPRGALPGPRRAVPRQDVTVAGIAPRSEGVIARLGALVRHLAFDGAHDGLELRIEEPAGLGIDRVGHRGDDYLAHRRRPRRALRSAAARGPGAPERGPTRAALSGGRCLFGAPIWRPASCSLPCVCPSSPRPPWRMPSRPPSPGFAPSKRTRRCSPGSPRPTGDIAVRRLIDPTSPLPVSR